MFMLNVKRYYNTKKEAFSSTYLLITEIHTYWSYGDGIAHQKLAKATATRWKSMFYVHYIIFMHKIIVMIDVTFGCDTCLALCQHINFKGLKLNSFSIGNVLENFEAS